MVCLWMLQFARLLHCLPPTQTYLPPIGHLADSDNKAETGLPAGWEVRHSNSKNLPYYFNESQKQSRWEPPSGTDTEKLKAYMAEHHSQRELGLDSGGLNGNANVNKIRASHLLVKHKDSRRPSSWREVGLQYLGSCYSLLMFHIGEYHADKGGSHEYHTWS